MKLPMNSNWENQLMGHRITRTIRIHHHQWRLLKKYKWVECQTLHLPLQQAHINIETNHFVQVYNEEPLRRVQNQSPKWPAPSSLIHQISWPLLKPATAKNMHSLLKWVLILLVPNLLVSTTLFKPSAILALT